MKITRTQLGQLIGLLLLTLILIGLPYLMVAFVSWQGNPAAWSDGERLVAVALTVVLTLARWVFGKISLVDDADAQRR